MSCRLGEFLVKQALFVAVFASLTASTGEAQLLPPTPQFQTSMDLAVALRAGDVSKTADLFAPRAVIMPPDAAIVDGRVELEGLLRQLFEAGDMRLSIVSLDSGGSETVGFDTGSYELTITPAEGERRTERGTYLTILRRDGEGRWRVAYGMWNRSGGAPASSGR